VSEVVTIAGIAAGGDGVGHLADGRAVFVPRAVPGDSVALRPGVRLHRSFARGEIAQVLRPGPGRVTPPCPHYVHDRCGGCQLQQLAYDAQLAAKRAIVGDALRRIGKLELADPEIVEAIDEWRYRSSISLAVARSGHRDGTVVGLHPYGRPGSVFPLADCHVADFRLMALWRELKQHLDLLPPRLSRLTLRLDREGRKHVIAESPGAPWQRAGEVRAAVSGGEGDGVICWWQPVDGAARVVAGPATGALPTAFEQVNAEMALLARTWAVDQLGDQRGRVVWDLYGGIGDAAVLLAERGAQVVSVDVDEKAVAWAQRRSPAGSARFIAARVEDVLGTLPEPHAALVDPPRAGLHWNVTLKLREQPVGRLAYISRDPATLARDVQRLSVNYGVTAVRAFDLFPQTADVETVVVLEAA
jgi:23S rRNA (uracil1939-C5)-methyltransferase